MRAGRLRHRLRFERRALTPDGARRGEWEEAFTEAGDIVFLRAGEPVMGARLAGQRPAILTIRGSLRTREIDNSWRAVDARRGTIFTIQGVTPNDSGGQLDIVAVAGGADG